MPDRDGATISERSSTSVASSPAAEAVKALQAALGERLVAGVLFGSNARGDASPDSDWDVLLIASGLPDKPLDRHLYLKQLLPPSCRGAVSLLARTPEEFEASLPSLYLDIAVDGILLYDRRGYAQSRLTFLRRLMARQGLRRQRTPDGDVWRWDKSTSGPWRLSWEA